MPFDGADRHGGNILPGLAHALTERGQRAPLGQAQLACVRLLNLRQIHAGRKMRSGSAQDDRAHARLVAQLLRGLCQAAYQFKGKGVARLRPVQAHAPDSALGLYIE